MKELVIFIRPKMYMQTKKALNEAGFHSMTIKEVIGRGKKSVQYELDDMPKNRLTAKKMIKMYVRDEDVEKVKQIIISNNQTGHAGDGKMFILQAEESIRIRTGQKGEDALM